MKRTDDYDVQVIRNSVLRLMALKARRTEGEKIGFVNGVMKWARANGVKVANSAEIPLWESKDVKAKRTVYI